MLLLEKDGVAIIGSRTPSRSQAAAAAQLAHKFSFEYDLQIRTGGADGIDYTAMHNTKPGNLYVFLPWATYNRELIPAHAYTTVFNPRFHTEWIESVERYHPNVQALSAGAIALHARNYGIVYQAKHVIALPSDKKGYGGTGQGIRISLAYGISTVIGTANMTTEEIVSLALKGIEMAKK